MPVFKNLPRFRTLSTSALEGSLVHLGNTDPDSVGEIYRISNDPDPNLTHTYSYFLIYLHKANNFNPTLCLYRRKNTYLSYSTVLNFFISLIFPSSTKSSWCGINWKDMHQIKFCFLSLGSKICFFPHRYCKAYKNNLDSIKINFFISLILSYEQNTNSALLN